MKNLEAGFASNMNQMSSSILRFGAALGAIVTGGGLAIAAKQAMLFETAIVNVGTILGESLPLLAQYKDGVANIAKTTSKDLVDLTNGLYEAISSGVSSMDNASTALDFLNQAQKAAVAGLSTTKDAVTVGAVTLNTYGKEAGTVEQIFDKFFQSVRDGVTTFPEIAAYLGNMITTAKTAGITFDELNAGLVQMTKAGVRTAEATTQLRQLFLALVAPTAHVHDEMKTYNIDLSEAALRSKGLAKMVAELVEKTGGNLEVLRRVVGSTEALNAALVLAKNGGKDFVEEIDRIKNATGTMGEAFDLQSKTIEFQIGNLKNTFSVFATQVYDELQPAIAGFLAAFSKGIGSISASNVAATLKSIGGAFETLISLVSQFSDLIIVGIGIKAANALGRFAAGGLAALVTQMTVAVAATAKFPVVAGAATIAMRGFGAALRFALGPIGLIIIAIEALVVAYEVLKGVVGKVFDAINASIDASTDIERRVQDIVWSTLHANRQLDDTFAKQIQKLELRKQILEDENALAMNALELDRERFRLQGFAATVIDSISQKQMVEIKARSRAIDELESKIAALSKTYGMGPELPKEGVPSKGVPSKGGGGGGTSTAFLDLEAAVAEAEAVALRSRLDARYEDDEEPAVSQAEDDEEMPIPPGPRQDVGPPIAGPTPFGRLQSNVLDGIMESAGNLLMQAAMEVADILSSSPDEFVGKLDAIISGIGERVTNFMSNLPTLASVILPMLTEVGQAIIAALPRFAAELIRNVIMMLSLQMPALVQTLVAAFVANLPALIGALVEGIISGIGKAFEKLIAKLNPFGGDGPWYKKGGMLNPLNWHGGGVIGELKRFQRGGIATQTAVPVMLERGEGIINATRTQALGGERAIRDLNDGRAAISGRGNELRPVSVQLNIPPGIPRALQELIGQLFPAEARRQGANVRTAAQVVNQRFPGLPRVQALV